MDILELLDKVLEISGVKEKALRSEQVIRLKEHFGLTDFESLEKFEDVYAYAVVEYSLGDGENPKPRPLVALFKLKEMRESFAAAYRENRPGDWVDKGQKIAQYRLKDTPLEDIDPVWEIGAFATAFFEVLQKTKSAKEIQLDQKINSLQESISEVQKQQPTLEAINQKLNKLTGAETPLLPEGAKESNAADLACKMGEWFAVLEYDRVAGYEVWEQDYFEWAIDFPAGRRRFSRTLVRGVAGEVEMADVQAFAEAIEREKADEGWLVGNRRVSKVARQAVKEDAEYEAVLCYTFDELLDEDADFSKYLAWLEGEIAAKGVDEGYLPLACRKDDIDPQTQRKMGVSTYAEEDGWIDGYVDMWLDDPAKEHLSVLGEFGTGKTWFALHYAQVALQRYREAKRRGTERPRIPVVVPLRDYAKAVSVESLFSEFFFRKHEILKNYSVFEQLNRMGKLLLIFDGFDEMAARVDRQAMIDNFWELAKVVGPGAKAILTCRTEHFPDAITGRQLLDAELESSTVNLTGETPQFEVLELEKLSDEQIATLIGRQTNPETVQEVMGNSQLLDLARRPVMVELILAALPEIEAGKPVDMARVYLYAVTRKMRNDIRSDRTFTSLADKLYFLCELSWKMISTNQMTLNYRAFPEALQQMFADRVKDEKELDHWRYDMMGQTMLIRNAEGDYSPAHRSLLEFFVAYKIVASLGAMAEDFTAVAREQEYVDEVLPQQSYTWDSYFKRECDETGAPLVMGGLTQFDSMSMDELLPLLRRSKLAKAVLDLAHPMLDRTTMRERLLPLLQSTAQKSLLQVGYLCGNIVQLLLAKSTYALTDTDLRKIKLRGVDFTAAFLRRVSLDQAQLSETVFSKVLSSVYAVEYSPEGNYLAVGDTKGLLQVWDVSTRHVVMLHQAHLGTINSIAFAPNGKQFATGSDDSSIKIWDVKSTQCIHVLSGHQDRVSSIAYSPDGFQLATGSFDSTVKLWSPVNGSCHRTLDGYKNSVISVAYAPDGSQLAVGCRNRDVKIWNPNNGSFIRVLDGFKDRVTCVAYSSNGAQLATGSGTTVSLWNSLNWNCTLRLEGHSNKITSITYSPDNQKLVTGSYDRTAKVWDLLSGSCVRTLYGHKGGIISLSCSEDGQQVATGSSDGVVKLWDIFSGDSIGSVKGHENFILSVAYIPEKQCILASGADNTIKIWNPTTGECIRVLEGHQDRVRAIACSPDGTLVASGSYDKTIRLWSTETCRCIVSLEGHTKGVRSVAYSPDGKQIASAGADAVVKLWNPLTERCIRTLTGHAGTVRSIAYSPSRQQLASGSQDKTIRLWDLESGNRTVILRGHESGIRAVAYSPAVQHIASGSYDNTVRLWNIDSGNCICVLEGHTDGIQSIAYSPDGQQIATCSYDKTIRLWTTSGICTSVLRGHFDGIRSVAYSQDGIELVSGGYDNMLRIWDVRTGACLRVIDDRVYAGLDITGAMGLTIGQKASLELMGAVDHGNE